MLSLCLFSLYYTIQKKKKKKCKENLTLYHLDKLTYWDKIQNLEGNIFETFFNT